MLRVLCVAAFVAAGSAKVADQQPEQIEPVYQSSEKPAAVKSHGEAPASLQNVQEYVDDGEILRINKQYTNPAALLSVSSETHVHSEMDDAVMNSDSQFLHAELVHDLDEHLGHDEKYVGQPLDTNFIQSAASIRSRNNPAQPPDDLPENMKSAFMTHAAKYEEDFQRHFKDGPPHAGSYLERTSFAAKTPPPSFSYQHTVYPEPQILLPVPAHVLYGAVTSEFERNAMLQHGLQEEARRRGARQAQNNNAGVFLETQGTAEPPATGASTTAAAAAGGGDFIDPYQIITPASMAMTNGGVGTVPGTYWTPTTMQFTQAVNDQQAAVQAAAMAQQNAVGMPPASSGVGILGTGNVGGVIQPAVAPIHAIGGVQPPPPPVIPYDLPAPPYVPPAMSESSSKEGEKKAA